MQRRKRYSRNWFSNRESRKDSASSCFKIIICLIGLSSCASRSNILNKADADLLKNQFKKICLNSEGQARVHYAGSKYLFTYEAGLKKEENKWLLAAQIPIHGEELMGINYAEDGKTSKILGSFYQRLISNAKDKNKKEIIYLKSALAGIGQVLSLLDRAYSQTKIDCSDFTSSGSELKTQCKIFDEAKKNISIELKEKELNFTLPTTGESKLVMNFSNLNKLDQYEKMQFLFFDSKSQKILDMFFFVNECMPESLEALP